MHTSARTAATVVGVHRNTATRFFRNLRLLIQENTSAVSPLQGEVEVDECYIGQQRSGQRGRSPQGKTILVGCKQRKGQLRVEMVNDVKSLTLLSFVKRHVSAGSRVYTDGFQGYNALRQEGYKHGVVCHAKEFVHSEYKSIHTNGIENVWRQLRRLFAPFNGVKQNIGLFLADALFKLNYSVAKQKVLLRRWCRLT